ncbi:hypothetical protein [Campylobacter hyointestinalis]|nr:hypothetical protein [Campylobacter hyointestinalis]
MVGDTAAICGVIWLGVVAIFGSGIWGGLLFWSAMVAWVLDGW